MEKKNNVSSKERTRLVKRVLAIVMAFAIVVSMSIAYAPDRFLRANEEGETVTFKVYQHSTGKSFSISESLAFVNMALEGMPSVPKVLHFIEPVWGDVNADGKVDSSDASAIVEFIMTNTYNVRADLNKDEKVNVADIVELNNLLKK